MGEAQGPIASDPKVEKQMLTALFDEYGIARDTVGFARAVTSAFKGYGEVINWQEPQFGDLYDGTEIGQLVALIEADLIKRHTGGRAEAVRAGQAGMAEFVRSTNWLGQEARRQFLDASRKAVHDAMDRKGIVSGLLLARSDRQIDEIVLTDSTCRYWRSVQTDYLNFFLVGCVLRDAIHQLSVES